MTLSQLDALDENELAMCLYVINTVSPIFPYLEILPKNLTWIKHDCLIKRLIDAFPQVLPQYHITYSSLMLKLGVKVEITPQSIPPSQ